MVPHLGDNMKKTTKQGRLAPITLMALVSLVASSASYVTPALANDDKKTKVGA